MERILIGEKIKDQDPYIVKVNGKEYETYKNKSLLRFLRDDLKLKSVKDGCSQGACGTCMVIIGEDHIRACIRKLDKVTEEVVTVEGLSQEEKDAFVYDFGECGAVQCGFCIPGMVMTGVSVIRKKPKSN